MLRKTNAITSIFVEEETEMFVKEYAHLKIYLFLFKKKVFSNPYGNSIGAVLGEFENL